MTDVLELKAIDTFRGPAHILYGVSLHVDKQEVVCLVGRNGAGKTTTIESIMGFLPLRSGQILFDDEDLTKLPPHERAKRGIGFSPEDCGVFPELTVSENLMISRWLGDEVARKRDGVERQDPEAQAFDIFPEVQSLLQREGLHLSGGQRKMVAIARAISKRPDVLLCDEPTGALDVHTGITVLDVIERINRELGTTTVVITHNAMISAIADRVVMMSDGHISEERENTTKIPVRDLQW